MKDFFVVYEGLFVKNASLRKRFVELIPAHSFDFTTIWRVLRRKRRRG